MNNFTFRTVLTAVCLGLFCLETYGSNVPDGQFITILANGVSNTYSLSSFHKATVENASSQNPTLKVEFNDGKSYLNSVRSISFELDEYEGDDHVVVNATDNTAEISWPNVVGAEFYVLTICRDLGCNEILCTLKFNSSGQLIEIAFGEQSNGGVRSARPLSFTVTGLEQGTVYKYTIQALGSAEQILDEQSGVFTTLLTSVSDNEEDNDNVRVYSTGKRIVVDSPKEHNISFYDVMGRQLGTCVRTNHCECVISLVGVYVIRVDDRQYKIRTN